LCPRDRREGQGIHHRTRRHPWAGAHDRPTRGPRGRGGR